MSLGVARRESEGKVWHGCRKVAVPKRQELSILALVWKPNSGGLMNESTKVVDPTHWGMIKGELHPPVVDSCRCGWQSLSGGECSRDLGL